MAPATIDPNFKNDYLQNWNLNIQREVTPTTTVTIGYYASKGTHLRISEDPAWAKLGGSIPEITSGAILRTMRCGLPQRSGSLAVCRLTLTTPTRTRSTTTP